MKKQPTVFHSSAGVLRQTTLISILLKVPMGLQQVFKIRQRFDDAHLGDVAGAVRAQLVSLDDRVRAGARIAIAVGSRGIDNLPVVVKAVSDYVTTRGAQPFIVPAMGSHGGATAEGQ